MSPSPTLERSLGPLDGAAIVVSNVIGVGIFTVPGIVAQLVAAPLLVLMVWLAGGLLAFAGASAYSELAAMRPRAGGEYVYLRAGFGPLAAFLTGWTSLVAGFSGAIAAGAVGFAEYLGRFLPGVANTEPLLRVPLGFFAIEVSPRALVAVSLIFVISFVHIRGLGPGRVLQNTLAALKVLALLVLIGLGFAIGNGSFAHFAAPAAPVQPAAWLLALIPVMFAYSGWNAAVYVAEEVREPGRNVPRALALGTGLVIALYLLLNVLYIYALPVEKLSGVVRTADAAAEALFGPWGADLLTPVIGLALAGSISAMVLAGPRVYFAMARDGLFLPAAARVHPRFRTPAVAILAQAIWSSALVLTGTFGQLLTYTGFAVVLFSGLAVLALFLLRRAEGKVPGTTQTARRPASTDAENAGQKAGGTTAGYRSLGYPYLPGLFVVAAAAMVANAIYRDPKPSLAGVGLIALGVPVYFWLSRRSVKLT